MMLDGVDREALVKKFDRLSIPEPNTGCWLWLGEWAWERHYGLVGLGQGRTLRAHRVAFELWNGPIPNGHEVCHRCDTPPCVNPQHLFTGTHTLNMRDMMAKKRGWSPRGEEHPFRRLTSAIVVEARALYVSGQATQWELAERFGVARASMHAALIGKTWAHIDGARHVVTNNCRYLTDAEVRRIREMYVAGVATQEEIAALFGSSLSNINFIVHGTTRQAAGGPIIVKR